MKMIQSFPVLLALCLSCVLAGSGGDLSPSSTNHGYDLSKAFESNRAKKSSPSSGWSYGQYPSNKGSSSLSAGTPVKVIYLPVTVGKSKIPKSKGDDTFSAYDKGTGYSDWTGSKTPLWSSSGKDSSAGWSAYEGNGRSHKGSGNSWVGLKGGSGKDTGSDDSGWTVSDKGFNKNGGTKSGWKGLGSGSKSKGDTGIIVISSGGYGKSEKGKGTSSSDDGSQDQNGGDGKDQSYDKGGWYTSKPTQKGGPRYGKAYYGKGWDSYGQDDYSGTSKTGGYSGYKGYGDAWSGSNGGTSGKGNGDDDAADDDQASDDDDDGDDGSSDAGDDGSKNGKGGSPSYIFGPKVYGYGKTERFPAYFAKFVSSHGSKSGNDSGKSYSQGYRGKTIIPILISIPDQSKGDDSDVKDDDSGSTGSGGSGSGGGSYYKSKGGKGSGGSAITW